MLKMGNYNKPFYILQRNLHMTRQLYNTSITTTSTTSTTSTISTDKLNVYPMSTNNNESYFAQRDDKFYQKLRSKTFKAETFKYQSTLPDLPVPDLKNSLQNYLKSVKPYTKDMSNQINLVDDFANGMGPILQERLINYSKGKRNWLSTWWDSQAYLNYLDPVIPYVSYFYNHKPLSHSIIEQNYLFKSTAIINSVIKFIESIKDQSLPSETIKGNPFCMNSFQLMFNNSRVPNKKSSNDSNMDTNNFYSIYENNFMVVMIKGNFYKLMTHKLDQTNNNFAKPLSPNEIYNQLQQIVINAQSNDIDPNTELGILTSLPRDKWNNIYWELIKDPSSKTAMEQIHKSSFILCLDLDERPVTLLEKSKNSWHGNGINRFYDKPLQFFVCGNGKSGFLAEHSKMDGTPTLFLNNFVCKDIANLNENDFINSIFTNNNNNNNDARTITSPEKLQFNVSPALKNEIKLAKEQFHSTINQHELNIWHYQKYGKNLMKKFGFSPDAYIQQIIQLAIYKYLGKQLPTYEAASTRKFFKGRTETVRSVSLESQNFVTNWCNPNVSINDKLKFLRESIASHVNYLKRSTNGLGIDRHFFGLKQMLKKDEPIPSLLNDPIFNYSSNWLISTSQLSSEFFDGYGWSQVNDNGFGLAYMINNDWLHINIVNKPAKSGLDGKKLQYYLTEAADEMATALQNESIKAKL